MPWKAEISDMNDDMQRQDVIKPSINPWDSPVVLVPKKDGYLLFCVDYRQAHFATRKDVYPLPLWLTS